MGVSISVQTLQDKLLSGINVEYAAELAKLSKNKACLCHSGNVLTHAQ